MSFTLPRIPGLEDMTPTSRALAEVTAPPPEPEYNPAPDFTAEDYPEPQPPPPELPAWQGEAWERMAPDTWSGGPSGGNLPPGFSAAPPMENWDPAQQVQPTGKPWEPSSNPYFGGGATATDVGYQTTRVADRAQLDPWGQPYADEYLPPQDYGRVEGAEYAYAPEGEPEWANDPAEMLPNDPSQYQVEGYDPWEEGDIRAGRPTNALAAAARGVYDLGKGFVESQQVLEMPDERSQALFGKGYGELTETERGIDRRTEAAKSPVPDEALGLLIGNIGGAGAGDDFARQLQKSLSIGKKGGKEALNAASASPTSTVAEMRDALTAAGRSSEGNRSAIIARYRGLEAEQAGGIGTPNENVSNAARTSYGDVLERSGDPEAARLAGRRSAAQEQASNTRAGEMSRRMDEIDPRQAYGPAVDDLPPIGGGAAMPNLTTRQVEEISHFADMTKGVIDDHSTMQRLYNSVRPVTAKITGDAPDSVVAELLAKETELGTILLRSGADPDDIAHTVDLFTGDMLKGRFKNDPARLKAAQAEITARRKAFFAGQGDLEAGVDAVSDLMRAGMLAGDVSLFGVQLLAAGRRGLVPILAGTANRIATQLHMPGMVQVYLRKDMDRVAQALADGVQMGAGAADISKGTMLNKIGLDQVPGLKKIPGAKLANVGTIMDGLTTLQYDWILGTVRLRAYEGQLAIAKLLGSDITDPLVRRHIAEYANTIGSSARVSTGMKRAKAERMGLLTARMTRASISEVITPLRSLRSREDALNTASLLGSFAIILGAGKALNDQFGVGEFEMDPRNVSEFGRVTLRARDENGVRRVVDIFPQFAFPRALLKSVAAFGEEDTMDRLADAWERYGIGRLNVVPAMMARTGGYGYDTTGGFHKGDMPMEERAKGNLPIPLSWRDAVLKGETNSTDLALDMTGVSSFPEGLRGARDRAAQERWGMDYNDPRMLSSEQREIDQSPDVQAIQGSRAASDYAKKRDAYKQDFADQVKKAVDANDAGKSSMTLPERLSELKAERFNKLSVLYDQNKENWDKIPPGPHDKTRDGYYDDALKVWTADGKINWNETQPKIDAYMAGLSQTERTWLEDDLGDKAEQKTQIEKDLDAYNKRRESLGYFKDGSTTADKAKLDAANPDIDLQTWRYYGGVEDKKKNPDPVLQSRKAVDDALALNLPGRTVKYEHLGRPINQSPQVQQAWKDSAKVFENYNRSVTVIAQQRAVDQYGLPFAKLSETQKQAANSWASAKVQKDNPDIDATLALWGYNSGTSVSDEAFPFFLSLLKKHGIDPKTDPIAKKVIESYTTRKR